jgi:hypothetical protein
MDWSNRWCRRCPPLNHWHPSGHDTSASSGIEPSLTTDGSPPRCKSHLRCATMAPMRVTLLHLAPIIALLASVTAIHARPVHAAETQPADAAELEAFLDGVVPHAMQQWHVPSAVILVVRDGTIFFQKVTATQT